MRARLASGAPRISRWPNLEILVPRPLARRVATPRESSVTVLPRASPCRRSRRAATKHHRNTILRPLVEDEADTAPIGALPARLSHLHGPVGLPAASPPGARSGGIAATPPRPEFAPSTPANRTALRGASGTLLMGPWNGAFARADDSADPKPDARRRPDAVARLDDDAREHLADVIFTGPDETPLDHESVALEKVLEDALTGRVVVAPELDDGESRGAPTGPPAARTGAGARVVLRDASRVFLGDRSTGTAHEQRPRGDEPSRRRDAGVGSEKDAPRGETRGSRAAGGRAAGNRRRRRTRGFVGQSGRVLRDGAVREEQRTEEYRGRAVLAAERQERRRDVNEDEDEKKREETGCTNTRARETISLDGIFRLAEYRC